MTPPRVQNRWLLSIVVFCIVSFKVILVPIGEAGIRMDDLLIALTFAWLLLTGQLRGFKFTLAAKLYGAMLCMGVVSALWNGHQGRVETGYSLLFVARQAEYMSFFCFGYCLKEDARHLSRALLAYSIALAIIVPAQMLRVIPIPGGFDASRAIGNTNGPYELAAVAGFLLCYLGYAQRRKLSGSLALLFIVLSAARITFVGTAFSLVRLLIRRSRYRALMTGVVIIATLVVSLAASELPRIVEIIFPDDSALLLASRFGGSSVPMDDLGVIYNIAPTYRNSDDYVADMFDDATNLARDDSGDVSGMIRAYRWTALMKTTLNSLDSVVLGLGPSFGTAAVDGYFMRAFIETGLVGLCLFVIFLIALLKGTPPSQWAFREYVIILAVTACFIDIFVAYKPMLLLWLWHGLNQPSPNRETHENCLSHAH